MGIGYCKVVKLENELCVVWFALQSEWGDRQTKGGCGKGVPSYDETRRKVCYFPCKILPCQNVQIFMLACLHRRTPSSVLVALTSWSAGSFASTPVGVESAASLLAPECHGRYEEILHTDLGECSWPYVP